MTEVVHVPFRYTFATWVYQLHAAGIPPADESVQQALAAVDAATDRDAGEDAGRALVEAVDAVLGGGDHPAAVAAAAVSLFGDRAGSDLGEGSRAERTRRIRRLQFGANLPWLARVIERDAEGKVGPVWHVVREVTDLVEVMDPNPWNEVDERRRLPLADFHVQWELDGCTSVYLS